MSNKSKINKALKKVHKRSLVLVALFCIIGVAMGVATTFFMTKSDQFTINGKSEIVLNVGDTYVESGATAIAFGKDISKNVVATGAVDTSCAGSYVIEYTVNHIRYKKHVLYRLITIVE